MNDMNYTEMNAITTWKRVSVECTDCNSGGLFAYNVFLYIYKCIDCIFAINYLQFFMLVRICEEWTNSTNYLAELELYEFRSSWNYPRDTWKMFWVHFSFIYTANKKNLTALTLWNLFFFLNGICVFSS